MGLVTLVDFENHYWWTQFVTASTNAKQKSYIHNIHKCHQFSGPELILDGLMQSRYFK